ncbi:MAG: alanine racemase [Clostridiales bacterium GWB2_37_7]|nr:MAG: alanine racemase [Clostridiales bacterium GWB2_37_7]
MKDLRQIRPAYAEINLDHLAHNIREVKRLAGKESQVMAVIKADGYGHGSAKIAQTLLDNGADRLAVAVLDEAIELRQAGFKVPIFVLGYTQPERAEEVVKYDLEQSVYSFEAAEALSKIAVDQNKTVLIHIKIDTGMGRIGLQANEGAVKVIKGINALPGLMIKGIFTHFAAADEVDKSYTHMQFEKFKWICHELEAQGINIEIKHCGNSAAIIDLPDMHLNMVRAGIMLYGLAPSPDVMLGKLELREVMSLKVRISHVKEIDAGQSVSYGRKFTANQKSKIASLPIGYADGYTRLLSGKSEALLKGKRVPIVGRICMDQCMIDVTGIEDVKVGDEVVLFGQQGDGFISIDEIAEKLGTINYEIVCMISRRVPRVYVKNGEVVEVLNYLY